MFNWSEDLVSTEQDEMGRILIGSPAVNHLLFIRPRTSWNYLESAWSSNLVSLFPACKLNVLGYQCTRFENRDVTFLLAKCTYQFCLCFPMRHTPQSVCVALVNW